MTRKSTQRQILVAVGRYVKQVDYEMVQRMRREKYRTDDATVGAYTAAVHPEQFDMIVRNLREDGLVRNPQRRTKSMGARWTSPAMSYEAATNYYPTKAAAEKKAEELRTYDEDWTYVVEEGSRGWRVGMYDEDGLKVANWSDPVRNPQGQTHTPAFKRWFGNSKVVDANGDPLVVYHGTMTPRFTVFKHGVSSGAMLGAETEGFYFTDDYAYAHDYGTTVMPVYLSLQNPYMVPIDAYDHAYITAAQRAKFEAAGYDGMWKREKNGKRGEIVVFRPEQIKSATDNRGTFDPSDPDIRHNPRRNPRLVVNPYKEKILLPSGNVQYVYSEQDVAKRHAEKAQRIEQLKTKEQRLRSAVKRDTEAGDPVATAVALIMATYERVGNNESAAEGHFGVTGWQARHFTRDGNKYRIDYVGKSGVEQSKVIDQPWLVDALAKHLRKKRKNERVLPVSASTVNRYLEEYDVSAKDLRGYGANTEMQKELTRLRKRGPALATLKPKDVIKTLKAEFNAALTAVAAKLGHTTSVLRKQYLVPALEPMYIESGAVLRTFA